MRYLTEKQKLLLALLTESNRVPERLELVKWAFLLRRETGLAEGNRFYDFVPYRYGPFSFEMYRDLWDLENRGLVTKSLTIGRGRKDRVSALVETLRKDAISAVRDVLDVFGNISKQHLLAYVYENYSWYATRSELTDVSVRSQYQTEQNVLYTKGYEGISVDAFFEDLLRKGVTQLVDVRRHAFSHKYGFLKNHLQRICERLGLTYLHLPSLGIASERRKEVLGPGDYKQLLRWYAQVTLGHPEIQNLLQHVFETSETTVLMCFEAKARCCHRAVLADHIRKYQGNHIRHL